MTKHTPHVRRCGSYGSYVLCLHSSTSSSKQWDGLAEELSDAYMVVAPDLYGYGKSPDWSSEKVLELENELELLSSVLEEIPGSFHLVGHSYGAAVAFKLALTYPERVRSLVVYEPVLFNVLFEKNDMKAAAEVWLVQDDVHWLLVDKRYTDAARRFIDYWTGEGTFDRLPEWQQKVIEQRMDKVRADFDATLGNITPLETYRGLTVPTLYLYGLQSPESTRRIADWMWQHLSNVEVRGLLPLGHMGPVTHSKQMNKLISRFIRRQPSGVLPHQMGKGGRKQA